MPGAVAATATGSTVALTWAAATDDVGVPAYEVRRTGEDGVSVALGTATGTSWSDEGVPAGRWSYRVVARDAAGNRGAASAPAEVDVDDVTAPTAPDGLTALMTDATTVALSWAPATDDVAVAGYDVHRWAAGTTPDPAAVPLASTAGTAWTDASVPVGTWEYAVVARDAAGHAGAASAGVRVEVLAPPPPRRVLAAVAETPVVVAVEPVEDAFAHAGAPATNYGRDASLLSRGTLGAVTALRFAAPPAPAGRRLVGAVLRLRTTADAIAGSADAHALTTTTAPWTESTLTWGSRPAADGPHLGTVVGATTPGTVVETPLDLDALAPVLSGEASVVMTSGGTDSLYVWSRNHPNPGYRPLLVLTYG